MKAYRDVVQNLNFKGLLRNFWSYKPNTPEEIETLIECRSVIIITVFKYKIHFL